MELAGLRDFFSLGSFSEDGADAGGTGAPGRFARTRQRACSRRLPCRTDRRSCQRYPGRAGQWVSSDRRCQWSHARGGTSAPSRPTFFWTTFPSWIAVPSWAVKICVFRSWILILAASRLGLSLPAVRTWAAAACADRLASFRDASIASARLLSMSRAGRMPSSAPCSASRPILPARRA